ncbi:MAG: PilN domain-containing protein [Acidimicrobiia bacterium]|nr:PilN domain-containing protein [Acidimicrobiia bacterium]NNK92206.1 PilN domain-containing protein [Acidimicrobiia bacterium]
MRPINLLPPEAFAKAAGRRRLYRILLIGLLYIAVLALLTLWWQGRVGSAEDEVVQQEEVVQDKQRELNALGDSRDLQNRYLTDVLLLQEALITDVSWGRLLNDLARMMPERVWLSTFGGSASFSEDGSVGTITVSGTGFDFPDVSAWLRSIDDDRFPSMAGGWVTSVSQGQIGEAPIVTFSSTTSLTGAAVSNRIADRVPVIP